MVVGADRIARNGDTANKIGTYGVAVLARHHGIPFYVAAPFSTIDVAIPDGAAIPIEERDPREVQELAGRRITRAALSGPEPGLRRHAGRGLITAIVTERGIHRPPYRLPGPSPMLVQGAVQMKKYHLLAPGPTPIPPGGAQAIAQPDPFTTAPPAFEALFGRVRTGAPPS